ncbi:hypothetical protein [Micromonospora sp. RP3T]|uniref:hypothetical protein n=1 Tax=Micromonospora sp. RP3T TaxID=2135446 RepID=UPI003D735C49
MTETTPPSTPPAAPGDEMRAMLTAGAQRDGALNRRGAVHLLTFTSIPAWRGFPALVDVLTVPVMVDAGSDGPWHLDGADMQVAFVRNWATLAEDIRAAHLSASARRLLTLAVSMATGGPVDLRENLASLGHAHARRVLEAVAIATGADEFYTLTATPALFELEARRAELAGGTR